ncbi:hypothetical protein H0H92_005809 [Tricholoma furcatifolium]|nr:hypothetical protein H0H92_005809 [Tricholoma furcatifolium]
MSGPRNPDNRPLPQGWISEYDNKYYVNTLVEPPVRTWTHPLGAPAPHSYGPPSGPPPPPNGSRPDYDRGFRQDPYGPQGGYGGGGYGGPPQQGYGGGYGGPQQGYGGDRGSGGGGYGSGYGGPPQQQPQVVYVEDRQQQQQQPQKSGGMGWGKMLGVAALGAGAIAVGDAVAHDFLEPNQPEVINETNVYEDNNTDVQNYDYGECPVTLPSFFLSGSAFGLTHMCDF